MPLEGRSTVSELSASKGPEWIAALAPRCVSLAQLGSHEVADEVMPASSA